MGGSQVWVVLNKWARELVGLVQEVEYIDEIWRFYPKTHTRELVKCRIAIASNFKREPSGLVYQDGSGIEYALQKYTFPDGEVYYEDIQAIREFGERGEIFIIFLGLKDATYWLPQSVWNESEINLQILGDAQLIEVE